jgi:hypothetical protein
LGYNYYDSLVQTTFIAPDNLYSKSNPHGVITYGVSDAALIGAIGGTSGATTWLYTGNIAEILCYHKSLTPTEIDLVLTYLRTKYVPKVNLGVDIHIPYGFKDTTLIASKSWYNKY